MTPATPAPSAAQPPLLSDEDSALVCHSCAANSRTFRYECERCGGPIVLERQPRSAVTLQNAPGIWRWSELFPTVDRHVTLGEGGTAMVAVPAQRQVLLKMESLNPTLSFKDRAMALGASWAASHGYRELVVASTGNAAVSASAYARAAGLACRVIVARGSEAGRKVEACAEFGAQINVIDGDYSTAYQHAREAESPVSLNVSTTYRNPIINEAYRGLAFEIVADVNQTPAAVYVPVGAGPLLRGLERGFRDYAAGYGGPVPVMVGVQAAAMSPLAHAWESADWLTSLHAEHQWSATVAGAIADPLRGYESEGLLTLQAAQRSGGSIRAVGEEEIASAHAELLAHGVWVEPASAAGYALAQQDRAAGPVVALMTGHGAKM